MLRFAGAYARYRARMAPERVKRLKELVDRLERLPASEDRDRVLREVRSRAVDLDTGVAPRAMLPVREPIPTRVPAEPAPRRDRPITVTRTTAARPPRRAVETPPPPAAGSAGQKAHEAWLAIDRVLSLEDSPEPEAQTPAVPPWTLGLRG
jgi:hypothetical protein